MTNENKLPPPPVLREGTDETDKDALANKIARLGKLIGELEVEQQRCLRLLGELCESDRRRHAEKH